MTSANGANGQRAVDYLLIGGGLASATAAEEIRKRDPNGGILIVSADRYIPYHRPPLSKEYLRGEITAEGTYGNGGVFAQEPAWYDEHRVVVQTGATVTALDPVAKTATLSDGSTIGYGKALIATGGSPRIPNIPGVNLPGVFVLRSLDDATAIREQLETPDRHVVILGSGFIGLETAANALFKGAHPVIVDAASRAWESLLTQNLSTYLEGKHTVRGGEFHFGYTISEFLPGEDGRLSAVRITSTSDASQTRELPADMAIVGVGVTLNVGFAAKAGLSVDPRHGIIVDEYLRAAPDLYVAGDVAAYPDPVVGRMHFEHWDNAIESGRVAGENMAGGQTPYRHVPYFFSDQFDLSINLLGYPSPTAELVARGTPAQDQFTAIYLEGDVIRAALMVNDDAQMDTWRELIATGATVPEPHVQIAEPEFDIATLKRSSSEQASE